MKPEAARFFSRDLKSLSKKAVSVPIETPVTEYQFSPWQMLPLIIEPGGKGGNLTQWVKDNRSLINHNLHKHGGILFRRFRVEGPEDLQELAVALSGSVEEYTYRSTPRTQVQDRIYTSTEYPSNQTIPMHNENSYASSWPMKIWFYCHEPAKQGGQTPIADSRAVYKSIDPKVRETFTRKKVMYVRNYGGGVDLPWQTVFQTADRAEMEAYCRKAAIEWEWLDGERLRTRQIMPAIAQHPQTGEMVWFNQAHLFHLSSLEPDVQESLLATLGEENLPRQTYYGDGSSIEKEAFDEVRRAYAEVAVEFEWQKGDVLLLDNMLVSHGRRPFHGPRKVLVAMAEPMCASELICKN